MNDSNKNVTDKLTNETRQNLKNVSAAMLRLHKILLEKTKAEYEKENGTISNPNQYLALVLDDPHFAWLRKFSALIALIDEAVSVRRPATETDAKVLLNEAKTLLNFEDADEDFNDKFQTALQNDSNAVLVHNDALKFVK